MASILYACVVGATLLLAVGTTFSVALTPVDANDALRVNNADVIQIAADTQTHLLRGSDRTHRILATTKTTKKPTTAASGKTSASSPPPAKLLNLKNFYLTLPSGSPGNPDTIEQPQLATFVDPKFFFTNSNNAVVFIAPAGGVTTKGSKNPRSELREMDGTKKAAWSVSSGKHTMIVTEAVQHLPEVKPSVVVAQIHDDKDDVVEVRLTKNLLEVIHDTTHFGALDNNYQLGTKFDLKIEASNGKINIFYNDLVTPKLSISSKAKGCYFKAGAYTQSNPSRGEKPDAFSEVWLFAIDVQHTD